MSTLLSAGKLAVMKQVLDRVKDVPGAFAECGVYRGGGAHYMPMYTARPRIR